MESIVKEIIHKYYGCAETNVSKLGGGYYAKVFLAEIMTPPYNVVVKVYLKKGLVEREKQQLETLSKYSIIHVPTIYMIHKNDKKIPQDVLVMEFIDGINAGDQKSITEDNKSKIADSIVDNLIHYHSIENKLGFGELDDLNMKKDWRDLYEEKAKVIYLKATELEKAKKLDKIVLNTMKEAIDNFKDIFYLAITKSSLIHGDYNTWNILVDRRGENVIAIIDPYNCCWGDSELDLYQLNNANGKDLDLLENYMRKCTISENFELKIAFYELFTEVMHYYDSDVNPLNDQLREMCDKLNHQMKIHKK